jgi:hypothetical protein
LSVDDFFETTDSEVERDKGGQPYIILPDGSGKTKAYTRASGLGDFVTDNEFLKAWHMRNLAVALGRRRDLANLAAVEPYNTGLHEPPQAIKSASAKKLDVVIARALDYVAIDERADHGSVVHHVTETEKDLSPYTGHVPMDVIRERAVFLKCLAKNKVRRLGSEMFTVQDEIRVAGTFDHLLWHNDLGVFIGDTKNGRNANNLGFSIQFADYANSVMYWPNGARMTLEEYVKARFGITDPINREVAVLFSVRDGECKTKDVDITWGWEMCKLAAAVRDARGSEAGRVKMSKTILKVAGKEAQSEIEPALIEWIGTCNSPEMLGELWREYKEEWTPACTNAATERKAVLQA